jgi:hypothetical protein
LQQRGRLFRIRCQVQIGVQDLAGAQHGALGRLRFLDLHDHVRLREDGGGRRLDAGAGGGVMGVGEADLGPGAGLHDHLVAARHQFMHAGRGQPHPVLVVFDFFGNAY